MDTLETRMETPAASTKMQLLQTCLQHMGNAVITHTEGEAGRITLGDGVLAIVSLNQQGMVTIGIPGKSMSFMMPKDGASPYALHSVQTALISAVSEHNRSIPRPALAMPEESPHAVAIQPSVAISKELVEQGLAARCSSMMHRIKGALRMRPSPSEL